MNYVERMIREGASHDVECGNVLDMAFNCDDSANFIICFNDEHILEAKTLLLCVPALVDYLAESESQLFSLDGIIFFNGENEYNLPMDSVCVIENLVHEILEETIRDDKELADHEALEVNMG